MSTNEFHSLLKPTVDNNQLLLQEIAVIERYAIDKMTSYALLETTFFPLMINTNDF